MGLILLVEDQPEAAALLRQYMENAPGGHRLAIFPRAAEALSYAADNRVDLFILDIQLLDYRGTELARQLRAMSVYRFTPILFTTELAGEELSAYREIKCYDFLVKPFTEAEFQKTLQAALAMGAQMQAAPEILRIEQKQFLFEYEVGTIRYIESFGKRLLIHTAQTGGREVTDQISGYSLSRLLDMVPQGRLLQCHKSFLVNPAHLCKIDKANRLLYLKGCNTAVPIGEKYQKAVFEREQP
ncbi:LytTR family DNA-binding domain-containing protein [uncultured Oscillibacter sp.]|uniref:LytR/AlgR family response regulator transcription factor n=1 Tax=uncultured Oscillibacter sp. TaxID=876091 RepID=UPI002805C4A1|nr:LytTR family DNA-binding domain-containing protein [uncultured Oscillibacter sp.]